MSAEEQAVSTEEYSVEVPLKLYFATEEPVAIQDITKSLLALEKLSKRFPDMLECLTDISINGYDIRVQRLESGSLLEDLVVKLYFDDPEKMEQFKEFLENTPMGKALKWGVGGVLTLLLVSQMMVAYQTFTGDETPSIQANHNVIINVGADQLGISPDEAVKLAKVGASGNRKKLFQAARDVLRPVEGHQNASLQVPGVDPQSFSYTSEALSEVPFEADVNAAERDLDYEEVLLQIRALDRDKADAGWWGVLPSVVGESRIRLHFDDDVDIDSILYKPEAKVDVTITYKNDLNHARLIPKYATITKIYSRSAQPELASE